MTLPLKVSMYSILCKVKIDFCFKYTMQINPNIFVFNNNNKLGSFLFSTFSFSPVQMIHRKYILSKVQK